MIYKITKRIALVIPLPPTPLAIKKVSIMFILILDNINVINKLSRRVCISRILMTAAL
jgi:hypothetical protein